MPASLHALGEDAIQFAFTKPSMLLVGDNEYSVSNWSDLLPIICSQFERENHEAFMAIANSKRIAVFGIEDDEHSYSKNNSFVHVVDNVYVRPFLSAASVLETMARIAVAYDESAGTDYCDNILFSLK